MIPIVALTDCTMVIRYGIAWSSSAAFAAVFRTSFAPADPIRMSDEARARCRTREGPGPKGSQLGTTLERHLGGDRVDLVRGLLR